MTTKSLTINLLAILIMASIGVGCQSKDAAKTAAASQTAPSVSDPSKGFYKHLRGTIGTFPVTMDLVKTIIQPKEAGTTAFVQFDGYYSYDKYQEPIGVGGLLDSMGMIQLEERRGENSSAIFTGKLTAENTFVGTWTDTLKKTKFAVLLRETYDDGAFAFDYTTFSDSTKLFQNKDSSPTASFDLTALLPTKNGANTEGSLLLRNFIFQNLKGDSTIGNYEKLALTDVKKMKRDTFFAGYLDALKDEKPEQENYSLNWAESSSMSIVFNENSVLSVAFTQYSFSGGAHGNYGSKLVSYDLQKKKTVELSDIFKPNYKPMLNAALERAARRQFGLTAKQKLSAAFLVEKIEANDNFCITRKGILFDYVPYEIASYAQGEIQLFVSFEELKAVLK